MNTNSSNNNINNNDNNDDDNNNNNNNNGDDRETSFLFQRLSVLIQRFNAILLLDSFVKEEEK